VLRGSPVIDARGALIGWVESVCTQQLDTTRTCGVLIRANCGPGRELFATPTQIACIADDHVRLSVTADAVAAPGSSAGLE
jgi:hypothetical protein